VAEPIERQIKYTLEINEADLAAQLEAVRTRVDATLAAAIADNQAMAMQGMGGSIAPSYNAPLTERIGRGVDQLGTAGQFAFLKLQEDITRLRPPSGPPPRDFSYPVTFLESQSPQSAEDTLQALFYGSLGPDRTILSRGEFQRQSAEFLGDRIGGFFSSIVKIRPQGHIKHHPVPLISYPQGSLESVLCLSGNQADVRSFFCQHNLFIRP
jgi:hypothetical protein